MLCNLRSTHPGRGRPSVLLDYSTSGNTYRTLPIQGKVCGDTPLIVFKVVLALGGFFYGRGQGNHSHRRPGIGNVLQKATTKKLLLNDENIFC